MTTDTSLPGIEAVARLNRHREATIHLRQGDGFGTEPVWELTAAICDHRGDVDRHDFEDGDDLPGLLAALADYAERSDVATVDVTLWIR